MRVRGPKGSDVSMGIGIRMGSASSGSRWGTMTRVVVAILAACLVLGMASQAGAATFNPEGIISNDNMRDYDSMSEAEIQAFLEAQTGSLATLVTPDYDKVITLSKTKANTNSTPDTGEKPKRASHIIWEACRVWKINPKVMLTMLQKEQSLLSATPKVGSSTLARAIGAGCPGHLIYDKKINPVATNKYPGFGNQIWNGARLLDGYGEGKNGSTIPLFYLGIVRTDIYRHVTLHPQNLATYKLYVYNPSIGAKAPYTGMTSATGNANFWLIYRRHFGGTYSSPRMQRVFRLMNRNNGTYLYTTSVTTRYTLATKNARTWAYAGAPFSVDTSVASTSTVPVHRFYNKKTHKYSYTRYDTTYHARRTAAGSRTWRYAGVAFRSATKHAEETVDVYHMINKRTGAHLYTASKSDVTRMRSTVVQRRVWAYEGIAFYLPRVETP